MNDDLAEGNEVADGNGVGDGNGIADGNGVTDGNRIADGNDVADDDGRSSSPRPSPQESEFDVPPLSQDNVFDALASKRSRYVLVALRNAEGPLDLQELVDTVAAWETDKSIDLVSEKHCKRVFTSLCHSQLPKLATMGLVTYDEEDSVVARGPYAEQADAYLDVAARRDESVDL